MNKIEIKNHKLFPTNIFTTEIDIDTQSLIERIYELQKENPTPNVKSNYGGWQSDLHIDKDSTFDPLTKTIKDILSNLFGRDIQLSQMWANINKYRDFNIIHSHTRYYDFSGVFYLKAPENSGDICFRDPRPAAVYSGMVPDLETFTPTKNMLVIFPSFLEHFVYPNETDEDRISISFDAI